VSGKRKAMFGIRGKTILVFVLIIFISLAVVGVNAYFSSEKIIKSNLVSNSQDLNKEIGNELAFYLDKYELVASYLAADANVKNVNEPTDKKWMLNVFNGFIAQDEEILYAYVGSKNGDMYIMPESDLPEDYDPRTRPWYTAAVESDELFWTKPYPDATTGEVVVSVAKPVYDNDGQFQGVVAVDISLDVLTSKLNAIQIGKAGTVYMTDSDGNIIIHPDDSLIGKPMPVPEIEKAMAEQEGGLVNYSYNGEEKFTTFETIEGVNWKVGSAFSMKEEISDDSRKVSNSILTVGTVALIIAIVASFFYARYITGNINMVLGSLSSMKEGDLTAKLNVKAKDEFGVLGGYFNETTNSLSGLVKDIKDATVQLTESSETLAATAEETSATSDEVARAVEDIAKGAGDQSEDAEKGAVLAQNLAKKFVTLNEHIDEMLESANLVVDANVKGTETLGGLRSKTNDSVEANARIEGVINELNEKTKDIGGILDAISSISEQTNLLALNASIEAARAGEHGRGFAVVAEEIRKLAEESSQAADEVREIVTKIQIDSEKTVTSMSEVKVISSTQNVAVQEVNNSFEVISNSISAIAEQIDAISEFMVNLNADKDSITEAIVNISAVSEETAASSQQVTASMQQQAQAVDDVARAAEQLNDITSRLNIEIAKFKV